MGFVVFVAMGLYLLASIGVVAWAISHAKKNGKSAKKWGWGAALVMYLIPFWDWIPTVAVHQYYCAKDSGFWVYKTLDQWKAENPGVMETLVANEKPVAVQNAYVLNQRFNWVIKQAPFFPLNYMIREEQQVVDSKTGEVLARYVDFSASHERRQAGLAGWKFWLDSPHCVGGGINQDSLRNFRDKFAGENK
jgi:hypothetical protein